VRVHILEHVPFETIGSIAGWLEARGASVTRTRFYESPTLPDLAGIEMVVVMGGTLNADQDEQFPWLRDEKAFIANAIAAGVRVLGICLGSQLIAQAMGARVYRAAQAEHGWLPVMSTIPSEPAYRFPEMFTAFQSHGDTFDLPAGAVRLARSAACENQAFQIGARVIALQFHLESTAESAGAIVEECAGEFAPGPFVQSASELRATPHSRYNESIRLMGDVLTYLADS
jgi:GMP synthase-like glutamine amidotransferase